MAYALLIQNRDAGESIFCNDHMVEQLDAHDLSALDQLLCYLNIGVAWLERAGGMVVGKNDSYRRIFECRFEYLTRVHNVAVDRSDRDRFIADDPMLII